MSPKNASRKVLVRALASALFGTALLHGGSASAIGLMEAYNAAVRNDPVYQAAYYENEGARENRIIGRAALLPNLSASYSGNKNRADTESLSPFTNKVTLSHPQYVSRNATITLRQPLLNLDAIARYKQGVAQSEAGEAQFATRKNEMAVRVVGAYVEALFAAEQLQLVEVQRDMYREQKNVNQRLFEKGEGTKTDMLETQARLDLAEAQVLEAQDNVRTSRTTLAGIIGQEVDSLEPLAGDFRGSAEQRDFTAWRTIALENNPEVLQATKAVEVARQQVNKDRAGHAPRLDLVASLGKTDSETINTLNQASKVRSVGLQLSVPLYAGGAVSAVTRQSVAGLERAKAVVQATIDKTVVELRKEHSAVESGVARIDALIKAVDSAKLLVTATSQSIKGGVRINLDLLNAKQQLFISQRDLAQARYGYLMAGLKLRAAAGTLALEDLERVATNFR